MNTLPYAKHPFTYFYGLVIAANLLFLHFLQSYTIVAKPMIVCSLLGFYIAQHQPQSKRMLLALIAALFGDIFLLFPGDAFFTLGLASFLVMQLLYISIFFTQKSTSFTPAVVSIAFIPLLFCLTFLVFAIPSLENLKIPVIVYALAISLMNSMALLRSRSLAGYLSVAMGSAFFILSDLLLAYNKFFQPTPFGHDMVMLTYMLAQWLIITGYTASRKPEQR